MSLSKIFLVISLSLFSVIGGLALCKKGHVHQSKKAHVIALEEVDLIHLADKVQPSVKSVVSSVSHDPMVDCQKEEEKPVVIEHDPAEDGLACLFLKGTTSPIVETILYKKHVPWKSHSSAWLVDYAKHYKTPLDFIYRSLNGGKDYSPVTVSDGVRFNIFRKEINFRFHLIISFASCRLRLYYILPEEKKVVFLKSYSVCLGKKNAAKGSGCLTPLGIYLLGERVVTFRPKMMGMHKGKKIELIQVFGSYWIPFEKAIGDCSEPARGFGIHGTPFNRDDASGLIQEDISSLGHFESDGCIRLSNKDMQELYSVISTHTTFVELVSSFDHSKLFQGEIVN